MVQRIEIVRGTTNTFQIDIVDSSGAPYNLKANENILFGIKRNPETEAEQLFVKKAEVLGVGQFSFKISPEDTENMKCGKYFYDVGIDNGTDFLNVIEPSPFVIIANVTSRGCGE